MNFVMSFYKHLNNVFWLSLDLISVCLLFIQSNKITRSSTLSHKKYQIMRSFFFPLSWQKEFTFRAKSWINVSIDLKNFLPMCGISVCLRWLCNITFCSVLIVVICKSDITVHEHVLYLEFWTLHWIVFKYTGFKLGALGFHVIGSLHL